MPSGWTVRLPWRDGCQCVFLGDGGESSRVVSQILGPSEFQLEGLVPVSHKSREELLYSVISQSLKECYLSD